MFSIIIPTLNNINYLKVCLDSLNKNSSLNNEILVHVSIGNDGTTDFLKQKKILIITLVFVKVSILQQKKVKWIIFYMPMMIFIFVRIGM